MLAAAAFLARPGAHDYHSGATSEVAVSTAQELLRLLSKMLPSPGPEILPTVPTGIWCATACCRRHGTPKVYRKDIDSADRAQSPLELVAVNLVCFCERTHLEALHPDPGLASDHQTCTPLDLVSLKTNIFKFTLR